jgi:hypothetical protein
MTTSVPTASVDAASRGDRLGRLATWVFAAPAAPYRRRGLAAVLYAVMFVVGSFATLVRTEPGSWNVLWAEDGKVFLEDAYARSFFENLVHPYAGYMHLVPRVVAEPISALVPADWAAIGFTVSASIVWSAVALVIFDSARGHVRHLAIRIVLWAMVIAVPVGGLEVVGNIANSHWFLIAAAFWALAARDRGPLQITLASVTVAVAALSDPLTAMLAPLVVLRLVLLRTKRANIVSLVFVVTIVVQLAIVLGSSRETSELHPSPGAMLRSFVMRIVVGGFVGRTNTDHLRNVIGNDGLYALGLAVLVLLVAIVVLCLRRTAMPAIALVFAVAFAVVTTWLTWAALAQFAPEFVIIGGSRYAVTPTLVLYAVVVIGADVLVRRVPERAGRATLVGVTVALAVVVASWAADFAPSFRPDLADAGTQFEQEGCGDDGVADITILPGGDYWVAELPCAAFDE